MRTLRIAYETHTLLRRNKVFLPLLALLALIMFVAELTGNLAYHEYRRVMVDLTLMGLHVAGAAAAIFWGVKVMVDARKEGSLEVQMATPASRTEIVVGRYVGLAATLVVLGASFTLAASLYLKVQVGAGLGGEELAAFALQWFIWLILGACAVFFGTIANSAVAIFACLCAWVVGALSPLLLEPNPPPGVANVGAAVAKALRFWNLQRFNLADVVGTPAFPSASVIGATVLYGASVIVVVLSLTCLIIARRDIDSR